MLILQLSSKLFTVTSKILHDSLFNSFFIASAFSGVSKLNFVVVEPRSVAFKSFLDDSYL